MHKVQLYFVLLFEVIIFSCKKTDLLYETSQLDSAIVKIDSSEKILAMVDTVKLDGCLSKIKSDVDFIQQNYKDTMEKQLAMELAHYSYIRKPLLNMRNAYNFLRQAVGYSREQMKNLKHDMSNNLLEEKQAKEYFEQENEAAQKILKTAVELKNTETEKLSICDSLTPKVEQIISGIKSSAK
jgi:hypothetical protein